MAQVTGIVIDKRKLEALQAGLRVKADAAVRKIALDVEAYAKSVVPVDTGNLKNSLSADQRSDTEWWIHTNVEYAPFVELGTSRMHAQPFLTPAVERARPVLIAAFKVLFET